MSCYSHPRLPLLKLFSCWEAPGAICFSGISLGLKDTRPPDLKQPDCLAQRTPSTVGRNFISRRSEDRRGKRVLLPGDSEPGDGGDVEKTCLQGPFPIHCGLRRRGAGSLGGGGEDYRVATGPLLWDLGYMGAGLFSLKGCDARSLAKRLVVE